MIRQLLLHRELSNYRERNRNNCNLHL